MNVSPITSYLISCNRDNYSNVGKNKQNIIKNCERSIYDADAINVFNNKYFSAYYNNITFSSLVAKPANKREIVQLTELFCKSLKYNFNKDNSNIPWIKVTNEEMSSCYANYLAQNSITDVIKSGNKVIAGYIMGPDEEWNAHISMMVLSPEYMRTKRGIKILKYMAERICKNARLNNMKKIVYITNDENIYINRLLSRFFPDKLYRNGGTTKYSMDIENVENTIKQL